MIKVRMHSSIEAGKILKISPVNRELIRPDALDMVYLEVMQLTVATKNGTEDLFVDYYYFNRYDPAVGGYFLRYNDGWCGYASEEVFKRRFSEDENYGELKQPEDRTAMSSIGVQNSNRVEKDRLKQTRSTR